MHAGVAQHSRLEVLRGRSADIQAGPGRGGDYVPSLLVLHLLRHVVPYPWEAVDSDGLDVPHRAVLLHNLLCPTPNHNLRTVTRGLQCEPLVPPGVLEGHDVVDRAYSDARRLKGHEGEGEVDNIGLAEG